MRSFKKIVLFVFFPCVTYWLGELYELACRVGLATYDDLTGKEWLVQSLIFFAPLAILVCSLWFGLCHGFSLWLPALIALLFVPKILYHNSAGMEVYLPIYAGLSLISMGVGVLIRRIWQKN